MKKLNRQEIWKDIKFIDCKGNFIDFTGLYKISNLGRVKSLFRNVKANKNGSLRRTEEKILKGISRRGYVGIRLYKDNIFYRISRHRLVAYMFLPNPNNLSCVEHKNTIRGDDRVCNLRWCSYLENNNNLITKERQCVSNKLAMTKEKRKKLSDMNKQYFTEHDNPFALRVENILTKEVFSSIKKAAESINRDAEWLARRLRGVCRNNTNFRYIKKYSKIASIKKIPFKGKVYDLKVENVPSYNIEGLAVHNSVGGSLISYALGITSVDPIEYRLLFSRFISEDRIDFPDIDIDFEDKKRHLVREHLEELYGKNNVVSISTFLKMKGRAAIRDVGRVFDLPLREVDEFAKIIDPFNEDDETSIEHALKEDIGKKFYKKYKEEVNLSIKLQGQIRGCLSGETRILLPNRDSGVKIKKLRKLFEENYRGLIRAYDYNSKMFIFEKVKEIYSSGNKAVYRLALSNGKQIDLTKDHLLLTKRGWVCAGELNIGNDYVGTNGKLLKRQLCFCGCGQVVNKGKKYISGHNPPWNKGVKGKQVAWNKGLKKEDHFSIMNSSLRWKENNPSKKEDIKVRISKRSYRHGKYSLAIRYKNKHKICESCWEKQTEEIHHIDKNPYNNLKENLLAVCISCHHKIHWEQRENKKINIVNEGRRVDWSKVVSFQYLGVMPTFDIEMDSAGHNFVANKIITHNSGQHAAGIIISGEDLRKGHRGNISIRSSIPVINWSMEDSEYMGLMKLDVLGLNALTVLNEVRRIVKEEKGIDIDFRKIPLDEKKVFEEISKGNNVGIFQLNTYSTSKLAEKIKCKNIFELSDIIALVRPGPSASGMTDEYIKRKKEGWKRKGQSIYDEIVKNTFGIIIYQEQIMEVVSKVAGLPYSVADKIRKVIGKKRDVKEFAPFKRKFLRGCIKQGVLSRKEGLDFWEMLQSHASYGFNKSHSIAYATLAYWCGWVKIKYPMEFICANLTYGSEGKKEEIVKEAYRLGLKIELPSIESNPLMWTTKDGKLYVPLVEVKGIGEKLALAEIEKNKQAGRVNGFFGDKKIQKETKVGRLLKLIQSLKEEGNIKDLSLYFSFPIDGIIRRKNGK